MSIPLVVFSLLGAVSFIAMMVIWILSIYHAATSQTDEMKQNRPLWILLIVFLGIIGSVVYYFVDDRKNWAIAAILSIVGLIVTIVGFSVFAFTALGLMEASR